MSYIIPKRKEHPSNRHIEFSWSKEKTGGNQLGSFSVLDSEYDELGAYPYLYPAAEAPYTPLLTWNESGDRGGGAGSDLPSAQRPSS
jgi:hypothetical protein